MTLILRIIASLAILMFAVIVLSSLFDLSTKTVRSLSVTDVIGNAVASIIASAWIVFLIYVLERLQ